LSPRRSRPHHNGNFRRSSLAQRRVMRLPSFSEKSLGKEVHRQSAGSQPKKEIFGFSPRRNLVLVEEELRAPKPTRGLFPPSPNQPSICWEGEGKAHLRPALLLLSASYGAARSQRPFASPAVLKLLPHATLIHGRTYIDSRRHAPRPGPSANSKMGQISAVSLP